MIRLRAAYIFVLIRHTFFGTAQQPKHCRCRLLVGMEFMVHTFGLTFLFGILLALWLKRKERRKHICIVVLGDIGRSPRMQYHAKSFADEGYFVELVGYPGSSPLEELLNNPNVKIHHLWSPPNLQNSTNVLPLFQIFLLYHSLLKRETLLFSCLL